MDLIEEHRCFGGRQCVYNHFSSATQSNMRFGLFLPPQAEKRTVPVLYWLSGLTCNEQNFITKAGAQRFAAALGLAIVAPDTSPRNLDLPGDKKNFDFGEGAGFYLDAILLPWSNHYRMETYIQKELPTLLNQLFPLNPNKCGIFGHSMGGHGALTLALKNPNQYRSVSAFAPICAPTQSRWGHKAFKGYLGTNKQLWEAYDACELVRSKGWPHSSILIDQGSKDDFLKEQLQPDLFAAACQQANVSLNLRMQEGYDHSYYFIASFIEDHLRFHARALDK